MSPGANSGVRSAGTNVGMNRASHFRILSRGATTRSRIDTTLSFGTITVALDNDAAGNKKAGAIIE